MLFDNPQPRPLVTVVIPCYNQARYLGDAIRSVLQQTYRNIEVMVIDDGSTDDTRVVAESFPEVKYVYQPNKGLSAARNAGMARGSGLFFVFLDADDVLYDSAVGLNATYLLENPSWAFVSGGHDKVDEWLYPLEEQDAVAKVPSNPYQELLQGNYIGMHGAVMYRCRVFDKFQFDTSLAACEDYDMYFKVARTYPVGAHRQKIAAYRQHDANMSADYGRMLKNVLKVHGRQRPLLRNAEERAGWKKGIRVWERYYATLLYRRRFTAIESEPRWARWSELLLMGRVIPGRFRDYVIKKTRHNALELVKRSFPDPWLKKLHQCGLYRKYTPPPGRIAPGDFNRLTPFSTDFGFDRGGAIDRFYIESFLEENRSHVRGRVLEIGDNVYTLKYGAGKVLRSDILHIDHHNARATYIGDITDIPEIPSATFDCIILTQTLHLIYDFTSALRTCYRILKPGGSLLLTVPGISHIDRGAWRDYWLWSFTDASVRRLMTDTFNGSDVNIKTYGNVYVAAAFLYGMGLPEFRKDFLYHHDSSYQVIIAAAAIKH